MTAVNNKIGIKPIYANKAGAVKHSPSLIISIMFILYIVLHNQLQVIEAKNGTLYYIISLLLLLIMCCYAINYLFFVNKRFYKSLKVFAIYMMVAIVMYLIIMSGLERLMRLGVIMLAFLLYKYYPLKNKEKTILFCVFVAFVAYVLINGTSGDAVSENKFNPNLCGLVLMLLFCVSLTWFVSTKRIRYLIIAGISIGLVFVYSSRTSLLGAALYFVLLLLFGLRKKTFKLKSAFWAILLLSVFGVLVAYIYTEVLFKSIGKGEVIIFGKDLFTGRQKIWGWALDSIRSNIWLGVGSDLNQSFIQDYGSDVATNAHNQSLGILSSYGLIVFICFYWTFAYLLVTTNTVETKRKVRTLRLPILFFAVITVMMYFEAYFFYSFGLAIIVAFCLIGSVSNIPHKRRCVPQKKNG